MNIFKDILKHYSKIGVQSSVYYNHCLSYVNLQLAIFINNKHIPNYK